MATQSARNKYAVVFQPRRVQVDTPDAVHQNPELFRTRALWILDIFPDELIIQQKTISVIRNQFLMSAVETMPVTDIGRVVYIDTPLLAGIKILGKNTAHDLHIRALRKKDALKAKQIIEELLLEVRDTDMPDWIHLDGLQQPRKHTDELGA